MKNYAPENAFFKLAFQFDVNALKADLNTCYRFDFLKNYVPANYAGEKYILPLRSVNGKMDTAVAAPNQRSKFKNTEALDSCPYFKRILEQLACEKEAVRLMSLPPGAVMNPHTDFECGYEDGMFRLHVPIKTNDEVYFYVNEKRVKMSAGECWYANFNLLHHVENKGTDHRVHLVIDCIRNEWSDRMFEQLGYQFELEEQQEQLSEEVIRQIIQELEKQKNDTAARLIVELKQQL